MTLVLDTLSRAWWTLQATPTPSTLPYSTACCWQASALLAGLCTVCLPRLQAHPPHPSCSLAPLAHPPAAQHKADKALGWDGFDDEAPDEQITVVLHHMFHPDDFLEDVSLAAELEEDLNAECGKLGKVSLPRWGALGAYSCRHCGSGSGSGSGSDRTATVSHKTSSSKQ